MATHVDRTPKPGVDLASGTPNFHTRLAGRRLRNDDEYDAGSVWLDDPGFAHGRPVCGVDVQLTRRRSKPPILQQPLEITSYANLPAFIASAFLTSDCEIPNCLAIADGLTPALKAARTAFSLPVVNEPAPSSAASWRRCGFEASLRPALQERRIRIRHRARSG